VYTVTKEYKLTSIVDVSRNMNSAHTQVDWNVIEMFIFNQFKLGNIKLS